MRVHELTDIGAVGYPSHPRFPRMGTGFPRSYIDQTPDEILYDPVNVLGKIRMIPTETTNLYQPRLETNVVRMIYE
jgi:hypothetical protein